MTSRSTRRTTSTWRTRGTRASSSSRRAAHGSDTYGGTTGRPHQLRARRHDPRATSCTWRTPAGRRSAGSTSPAAAGSSSPPVVADPDGGQFADSGCRNLKGIRDADADSAGNVYVTGYLTNDIAKFDPSGNCVDWGVTGTGPGQFRTPYGVRVAVDPVRGRRGAVRRRRAELPRPGVHADRDVHHRDGRLGRSDRPRHGRRRRAASRRSTTAPGDIWLADLWGNRIERYTAEPGGYTYAQTIGAVMPPEDDTHVFQEARQVAVGADGVVNVMDTVHHRIVRMDRNGHILNICGSRATEGAELGKFNWPRGLAIDNATGQLWVADTKQNRIQIVDPNCTGLEFIGDFYGGAAAEPVQLAVRRRDPADRPHRVRLRHAEQPDQDVQRRHPRRDRDVRRRRAAGSRSSSCPPASP